MIGRAVGNASAAVRDWLGRGLVRLGVTPNALTLTGMVLMAAAGVCYAFGAGSRFAWSLAPFAPANCYLLGAGVLMFLANACDMLDGAVARLGGKKTPFGAFLDSTLDRYSDFAVYAGVVVFYSWNSPANVTFMLLALAAFVNAFMISYTRARAEDIIQFCTVGYWQRGERSVAILIATFAHNIPALLVQQAALPLLTVLRRIAYTRAVTAGRSPVVDPRAGGFWLRVRLWRWPRATPPYDAVTLLNMAWLIFARFQPADLLRRIG